MNEDNKYNLYDNLVATSIINLTSFSKNSGKIIIKDFDRNDPKHMFIFNTALISCMYRDIKRKIYLDTTFWEFLKIKWPNRKRAKIKRYKDIWHFDTKTEIINVEEILQFMAEAYNVNIDIFDDIYNEYYKN